MGLEELIPGKDAKSVGLRCLRAELDLLWNMELIRGMIFFTGKTIDVIQRK